MADEKAKRIEKIIEIKGFNTKAAFANAIGVTGATLSFIFSGRNNVSQSIIEKITKKFPDVSLEWLMTGKEPMLNTAIPTEGTLFPEISGVNAPLPSETLKYPQENGVKTAEIAGQNTVIQEVIREKIVSKKIVKITVFYDDNTFEEFCK
ncbi:MAG: helix-turn-helix domain-containing protein [Dysgonamonadaceae bacterium]|jgi:hypothetical protein|nr:helix-turn-helix domain-containing protein [Dysgonamonadaceae bacterium]